MVANPSFHQRRRNRFLIDYESASERCKAPSYLRSPFEAASEDDDDSHAAETEVSTSLCFTVRRAGLDRRKQRELKEQEQTQERGRYKVVTDKKTRRKSLVQEPLDQLSPTPVQPVTRKHKIVRSSSRDSLASLNSLRRTPSLRSADKGRDGLVPPRRAKSSDGLQMMQSAVSSLDTLNAGLSPCAAPALRRGRRKRFDSISGELLLPTQSSPDRKSQACSLTVGDDGGLDLIISAANELLLDDDDDEL